MKVLFIGGGNMATALIGGLVARGTDAADVRVVEPFAEARARLSGRFPGARVVETMTAESAEGLDLAVLSVKPQQMREAAQALAPFAGAVPCVLSIAAGIRLRDLSRWLGGYRRLVRAMPNTPAMVGAGISGIYAFDEVDGASRDKATAVLAAGGDVIWCESEEAIDGINAVSGNGPAYVFYFLESLERAAIELGFAQEDARKLAYATVAGSIRLAQSTDAAPAVLRAQVTSKGGTTERAIGVMESEHVQDAIVKAVKAGAVRARELGDAFGSDA